MRSALIVVLVAGLSLAGCARSADSPDTLVAPAAPSVVAGNGPASASSTVELPFHSDLVWTKTEGSEVALCTHALPAGKVYLQRNHLMGVAVSTHLGKGEFDGHTCVYGPPGGPPQGWFADFRWTAANGDALIATSEFLYWTGVPGKSVAVDRFTFQDGGTGRFQFAEGEGTAYINAPARTSLFEGMLRYGRKE